MDEAAPPIFGLGSLAGAHDLRLGSICVSPARRHIEGPAGSAQLQPQAMLVFLCLLERKGEVVPRRFLFERCWGGAPVGDDSINQAISSIRHALASVGPGELTIETVPRAGYRLLWAGTRQSDQTNEYAPAIEAAYDCWRLGWPRADLEEIAALEAFLVEKPTFARGWGVLALLLRKAAEYANSIDCTQFVSRCEVAVRQAFNCDSDEPNAKVALAGLTPLFGNWATVRTELTEVLKSFPNHAPALHDMVFLEMATGRPSVALPVLEQLLIRDRFAATYHYKAIYQLWTVGRLSDCEQVAARAMALWPRHPAIWLARFWTLVGTHRADQALRLVSDEDGSPGLPSQTLALLEENAALVARLEAGGSIEEDKSVHAANAVRLASFGPANALTSLHALCALDCVDQAFEVAYGYYLGRGGAAVPLRWNASDPSVTDQFRRVTQLLFIPAASCMRNDPRFLKLCEEIGMSAYWHRNGIVPDFLS